MHMPANKANWTKANAVLVTHFFFINDNIKSKPVLSVKIKALCSVPVETCGAVCPTLSFCHSTSDWTELQTKTGPSNLKTLDTWQILANKGLSPAKKKSKRLISFSNVKGIITTISKFSNLIGHQQA